MPEDYDTVTYPLTKLGWDIGAVINPIMYTKKEWEASRITPFYHNVVKDAPVRDKIRTKRVDWCPQYNTPE